MFCWWVFIIFKAEKSQYLYKLITFHDFLVELGTSAKIMMTNWLITYLMLLYQLKRLCSTGDMVICQLYSGEDVEGSGHGLF
jgi:hypothetical protein